MKRVVMLLLDGARADVMMSLLHSGKLPEIQQWLLNGGGATTAVTTFPSTTGPAYLPFLTGSTPGRCNIPGIRWFDKTEFARGKKLSAHRSYVGMESYLMGRDICPPIQTVFELLPDSYSIFNAMTRGAGRRNKSRVSRIWHWYYAHLTDRWSAVDDAALKKVLHAIANPFHFLFTVFPGVDEYSHLSDPQHPAVLRRYEWFDGAVGEICRELKRRSLWETTALWIVSDHGLSGTHTHFCLNRFLESHDLAPFYYPRIHDRRGKRAASMVSGNGMSHLYFCNHDGWGRPTTLSELNRLSSHLVEDLLDTHAVDLVALRGERESIHLLSRRGEALLSRAPEGIRYEVLEKDPCGYDQLPSVFSDADSLKLTSSTDYPDAPYQLLDLFRATRTGDVVISATPGFDLRLDFEVPEHKGSHGSLHKDHMHVPVLCNRPLPCSPFRTVDIFPTMLRSLGHAIPTFAVGHDLAHAL